MTKQGKKIKELNLMLDRVVGYLNTSQFVIESHLGRVSNDLGTSKSFRPELVDKLERAVKVFREFEAVRDMVGRPLEQRPDGLYYTGRDR